MFIHSIYKLFYPFFDQIKVWKWDYRKEMKRRKQAEVKILGKQLGKEHCIHLRHDLLGYTHSSHNYNYVQVHILRTEFKCCYYYTASVKSLSWGRM